MVCPSLRLRVVIEPLPAANPLNQQSPKRGEGEKKHWITQAISLKPFDLMLCGGGVIGLSIAYQCAQHGWKVLVVDSMAMGQAASWAGAGILPAGATIAALDPLEQLRSLSHLLHRDWAKQLLLETGIDNEYRQCGGVYLARTAAERATLSANRMWWDEHGIRWPDQLQICKVGSALTIAV